MEFISRLQEDTKVKDFATTMKITWQCSAHGRDMGKTRKISQGSHVGYCEESRVNRPAAADSDDRGYNIGTNNLVNGDQVDVTQQESLKN